MRALRSWPVLLGSLVLAGLPVPAGAQPVGEEFQVNTYTTGSQSPSGERAVAADASGNFVVVWQDAGDQDGDHDGVFGQRYDGDGVAQGDEFQINTYTTGNQISPAVTSDASGNFVVVWERAGQGDRYGIFGQRYDGAGGAQGDEFRVNSYTTHIQGAPSAASDASGNFVVVWQSNLQDGSDTGVFGQRYDSGGVAQGDQFRVNSYTTESQSQPSVASDASGNFVVVWQSHDQDGNYYGIFGQRYDSGGVAQGDEFRVSPGGTGETFPSVASDASGNFVVAWEMDDSDPGPGSSDGVFGQRYDSAGVAQGDEFQINTYTTFDQSKSSVTSDASGNVVAVWQSIGGQDGSGGGVFGQRFGFAGLPSLSISDVSVEEGNLPGRASRVWARFAVTLSAPSTQTVTLDYATANGSAMAPSDYAPKSGTLTLNPGQTSAVIAVRVKEDDVQESDETFFVNLSNPANATIADGQGIGTILNDDP